MIDCYQEPVFQKWSPGIETYNKHCTINIPCFEISVKCTFIQLFYFYTKKLFYLKSLKALLSLFLSLSVSLSKIRKTPFYFFWNYCCRILILYLHFKVVLNFVGSQDCWTPDFHLTCPDTSIIRSNLSLKLVFKCHVRLMLLGTVKM